MTTMYEHTPGFYAIELQRLKRNQEVLRTALIHSRDKNVLNDYNANLCDLLGASVNHNLCTDDKIDVAHDMAHEYIKMPRIKQWLSDIRHKSK